MHHFKTWAVYEKSFQLALQVYGLSRSFPQEEKYSLTDQVRRSSRSICANLAEAYGARRFTKKFAAKITICLCEYYETQTWLDFALAFEYIDQGQHQDLQSLSDEVRKLLHYMENNPEHYCRSR
ncbi:diversity-generating retroelement protein bAvd family protein [Lewinellaceae bacterium SD302]|nr:diversity-generating retroelement protein bAvd family protein [Lewinellaceae bacterium SD302]